MTSVLYADSSTATINDQVEFVTRKTVVSDTSFGILNYFYYCTTAVSPVVRKEWKPWTFPFATYNGFLGCAFYQVLLLAEIVMSVLPSVFYFLGTDYPNELDMLSIVASWMLIVYSFFVLIILIRNGFSWKKMTALFISVNSRLPSGFSNEFMNYSWELFVQRVQIGVVANDV